MEESIGDGRVAEVVVQYVTGRYRLGSTRLTHRDAIRRPARRCWCSEETVACSGLRAAADKKPDDPEKF